MANQSAPKKVDESSWGNFGKPNDQPSSPWDKFKHITMPITNLFHSGGIVKKTGNYRLRKKEMVLTVSQQKSLGIHKSKGKKTANRKRVASKG